jgi:hypothetical protein
MRSIQYAAAFRLDHQPLWNTGSSAFADDYSWGDDAVFKAVIASEAKQSI